MDLCKATREAYELLDITNLSDEELRYIYDRLLAELEFRRHRQLQGLRIGDPVYWTSPKTGAIMSGQVLKVNTKTATVQTGPYSVWRVSPGLLTKGVPPAPDKK